MGCMDQPSSFSIFLSGPVEGTVWPYLSSSLEVVDSVFPLWPLACRLQVVLFANKNMVIELVVEYMLPLGNSARLKVEAF